MSDTNKIAPESWSDTITRAEFVELYDRELTDFEWEELQNHLDDAVADAISDFIS